MDFVVEKEPGLIPEIFLTILDSCTHGISLADPDLDDMPLVYVNRAFELMSGFSRGEAIGKNCRFMHGKEQDQPGLVALKIAIQNRIPITVDLLNFRKSNEPFYARLTVTPIYDSQNRLLYFLGIHREINHYMRLRQEIIALRSQLEVLKSKNH